MLFELIREILPDITKDVKDGARIEGVKPIDLKAFRYGEQIITYEKEIAEKIAALTTAKDYEVNYGSGIDKNGETYYYVERE